MLGLGLRLGGGRGKKGGAGRSGVGGTGRSGGMVGGGYGEWGNVG